MTVTGERIVTQQGGFNVSWQRHAANYALAAPLLGPGRTLDVGCGVGHAHDLLAPRETVGVDLERSALVGQTRATACADMYALPFRDSSFESVVAIHSIEHVPRPDRALAEVARVTRPCGRAIFATPNRLTFGRPDEIIDPYHFVELDPEELYALCSRHFSVVQVYGLFGSSRYMELFDEERRKLAALLRRDPLRLRRFVPRKLRQRLYDWRLTQERLRDDPRAAAIDVQDFTLGSTDVEQALDLVAVCDRGARPLTP